jgi:hypothetical protein
VETLDEQSLMSTRLPTVSLLSDTNTDEAAMTILAEATRAMSVSSPGGPVCSCHG